MTTVEGGGGDDSRDSCLGNSSEFTISSISCSLILFSTLQFYRVRITICCATISILHELYDSARGYKYYHHTNHLLVMGDRYSLLLHCSSISPPFENRIEKLWCCIHNIVVEIRRVQNVS